MAEEKATVKAEDTTVEKESTGTDETQEEMSPLMKAQEDIASKPEKEEETSEPLTEKTEEETEETEEETKEESEEEDTSTAKKTDGEKEEKEADEGDELSELLEKTPKKDGKQKRIDKLTAQLRETQERLSTLEKKEPKDTGEKEYTPNQLRGAMKKAIEEDDSDLMMDIFDYQVKKVKTELRKEYTDEQTRVQGKVKANAQEWSTLVESYDYLTDPKEREIFEGSRQALNLKNNSSLLYKLALHLYTSPDDEELRKYYQSTQGGQKLAVADALALILRKQGGKRPKDKEKVKLQKKLAKAKRRSSLSTGGAEEAESTSRKAMTDRERLDDYIKSRKKDLHSMRDSMGRSSVRR